MRPSRGVVALSLLVALAARGLAAQALPSRADSARRDSARAAAPPATDVWVARLSGHGLSRQLQRPENVTHRAGYDNQPSFTPDGRFVLYTAIGADGQADIWKWDARAGTTARLTTSAESEYSPTVTPDGRSISVIRVERDSTQRLWRLDADGRATAPVLERVKPVGYHAWIDARTLVLFVLGEPATLQVADARTGEAHVVADSIGRSLHRIPGTRDASFVRKGADGWWIERLDPRTGAITRLVRTLEGSEDYAWTPDGTILMAKGTTLYAWRAAGDGQWHELARVNAAGLGRITRLAVSPSGDRIAFAAEEAATP